MPTITRLFVATKPFKYGTRALVPGDEFEPKTKDARILLATKKCREVRQPTAIAPPPADLADKITTAVGSGGEGSIDADLVQARDAYREKFGRVPFYRWDAATIRQKIAEG